MATAAATNITSDGLPTGAAATNITSDGLPTGAAATNITSDGFTTGITIVISACFTTGR